MYRPRVQSEKGRPTRDDVAKLAQISGATVSRVLSGRTDIAISDETRQRVMLAASALGYHPNPSAKALRSGRTNLIGFWVCLQYSRYRSQVVDKMRTLLAQTEFGMAITDADQEFTFDHSFVRVLRIPVDGIIAFDASASVETFARNQGAFAPPIPFVSMGAYWSDARSFVGVDLRHGAEQVVEHLVERGRKSIAYLAPWNSGLLTEGPRYEAYRDKMLGFGLSPDPISVAANTVGAIQEALELRKSSGEFPDAIFCMNDDLALDTMSALERMGLAIGQDVAVVGFNGTEGIERGPCPLSTIEQPIEEMCTLAIEFLREQIADPKAPVHQKILKPKLVVRESSGR